MDRGRRVVVILMMIVLFSATFVMTNEEKAVRTIPIDNLHASFQGEIANDYSGSCVEIIGDVNGDGYDDFAIGAWGNDDGGSSAGKVYVFLGRPAGWKADTPIENADATFIGENTNDYAGRSIAGLEDVNGDGFDDFAIGAWGNDDGGSSSGKIYIVFGRSTGWSNNIDLADIGVSYYGEGASEEAGEYLAGAGDVNRDGYNDILISSINNDESGSNAGKVYLILGKESGWPDHAQLSIADASFRGESANDIAGRSIDGAGDVNMDGFDDIIIGAPINGEASSQAGQVYLIFGKRTGWSRNTSLSSSDASFRGETSGDQAGICVAGVGDINGDSIDDLVISAPLSDDVATNAGEVYFIHGKPSSWNMDASLSSANGSFVGEVANDELGWIVASAGDYYNDGFNDFIVTSRLNDEGGTNAGKSYIMSGQRCRWGHDRPITAAYYDVIGDAADDYSGFSTTGDGDINGDGNLDILIGAYGNDERGTGTGQTYLYLHNAIPPPPRNLRYRLSRDGTYVHLEWDPPEYWPINYSTYWVHRSLDGTNYRQYDNGLYLLQLWRRQWNVTIGQTYYYAIQVVDRDGVKSPLSEPVKIYFDKDWDQDGLGDGIDNDDDNDGIIDEKDSNPFGRDFTNWGRVDINLSTIGNRFIGEARGDMSGLSMDMSGDVNGDGIDDLVIGAYSNDDGGSTAGKVYLFFGQSGGWSSDVNLSSADATFIGEESNDRAGISVTNSGDVNGDGYNDIIIGADEYLPMGGQRGRAYIIYGKSFGWRKNMDLSRSNVRLQGEYNDDEFGRAVASGGDINGDGYDDILFGAPSFEPTSANFSGKTYLLLGRPSFPYFISASSVDAAFVGAGDDEHCGCSVALDGDVNGDGYDDIIIGAKFYKKTGGSNTVGRTYLLLGNNKDWSGTSTLTKPDASFIGQRMGAGWSVASAGDVNNDNLDDILIGEPENYEGGSSAGQVYLILGKESNWTRDFDLGKSDASFWGESALDNAGYYVDGAGDVNWDGIDDILIGAPRNDQGGKISPYYAGKTYVVYGKEVGWKNDVDLEYADVSFYGEAGGDMSGYSVAGGGDLDNDGRPDILIGAWAADLRSTNTGTTYLIGHTHYEPIKNTSSEYREGSEGIHLSWDDTVSDPGYYGIYRGILGGSLIRLANTTSSNYTDWDITLGLTYTYYIVALDPFGTSSPLGNPIHVLADKDSDEDGIGNSMDWDDDGDGIPDGQDFFPMNASEWLDTDLDGIGNNADADDDNDGIPDLIDSEPLNPLNAVSVDLDELYDRLVEMEGNLTASITSMQSGLNTRLDTIYGNLMMNIRGMNATMRTYIASQITPIFTRLNSLQASLHAHIEDLWDDYNSTEADRAQYLIDMNDRIMLAISDLETAINARFDGMAGPDEILMRINDLEGRYNISMADLSTNVDTGFTSLSTLMEGEFTDLEAYLALRFVQISNEMEMVNISLHHHLDRFQTDLEELIDEEVADLVIVIDGEFMTVGELISVEFLSMEGNMSDRHDEILEALGGLAVEDGNEPLNLTTLFEDVAVIRSSMETLSELDEMITQIETIETTVETSNTELAENDDSIKMFLFILIALVAVAIILMIVNIVFTKMGKKEKVENWDDEKK